MTWLLAGPIFGFAPDGSLFRSRMLLFFSKHGRVVFQILDECQWFLIPGSISTNSAAGYSQTSWCILQPLWSQPWFDTLSGLATWLPGIPLRHWKGIATFLLRMARDSESGWIRQVLLRCASLVGVGAWWGWLLCHLWPSSSDCIQRRHQTNQTLTSGKGKWLPFTDPRSTYR